MVKFSLLRSQERDSLGRTPSSVPYFFVLLSRPSVMETDSDGPNPLAQRAAVPLSSTQAGSHPFCDSKQEAFLNSHGCPSAYWLLLETRLKSDE
jgi:hypothetical protein